MEDQRGRRAKGGKRACGWEIFEDEALLPKRAAG